MIEYSRAAIGPTLLVGGVILLTVLAAIIGSELWRQRREASPPRRSWRPVYVQERLAEHLGHNPEVASILAELDGEVIEIAVGEIALVADRGGVHEVSRS